MSTVRIEASTWPTRRPPAAQLFHEGFMQVCCGQAWLHPSKAKSFLPDPGGSAPLVTGIPVGCFINIAGRRSVAATARAVVPSARTAAISAWV
jgi:hypothetical protein